MISGQRGSSCVCKGLPSYKPSISVVSVLIEIGFSCGVGVFAKSLKSFTISFIACTWPMIVSVLRLIISSCSGLSLPASLCCKRSAESWIGVSGFLISCAKRLATSLQAIDLCALTTSVMSSKTTIRSSSVNCVPRTNKVTPKSFSYSLVGCNWICFCHIEAGFWVRPEASLVIASFIVAKPSLMAASNSISAGLPLKGLPSKSVKSCAKIRSAPGLLETTL